MPKKKKQYQSSEVIYRPSGKDVYELPDKLLNSYSDPSLWAYSTLEPCDGVKLVNVYIITQGNYLGREEVRQRMWLHDILDDEGIPYQVVVKGYWAGRRVYAESQFIYVKKKHADKVEQLINEFNDLGNSVPENTDEMLASENYVDGIPQIKCPSCGREIDFDYNKCPFCNCSL